ncbi:MAG TPA: hypothetical protein VFV99_14915 [Kofleriaceae bacterium]|nr:hypothetical protein [Kofleriaceae bacterium]
MRATFLVIVLSSACYSPGYRDCEITCASQQCPSGYSCNAGGFCVTDPQMSCSGIGSDGGGSDVMPDMGMQGSGTWNPPMPVPFTAGSPTGLDDQPSLTDDMRTLYTRRIVGGQSELYSSTRQLQTDPFPTPAIVSSISTAAANEITPELGGNGLTIFYGSDRGASPPQFDIWFASRNQISGNWQTQTTPVQGLASTAADESPTVARDGLTMVFCSLRMSGDAGDIYLSNRATQADPWGAPMPMTAINNMGRRDEGPFLSTDKLTIYFSSDRPGGTGGFDLWQATRPDLSSPFGMPTPIMELNTSGNERDPWVSPDGKRIFFTGMLNNVPTIMQATR